MKKPRRRQLTDEEEELWRVVVQNITPLEARGLASGVAHVAGPLPADVSDGVRPKARPSVRRPAASPKRLPTLSAPAPAPLHPESAYQMNRGWERKLRRGTVAIDGRLDLHGLTRDVAFSVLHRFLLNAVREGKRCLLVITGKGGRIRGDDSGVRPAAGILKSEVPRWLYHGPMAVHILSVEASHPKDGGSGAYYVILRRSRSQAGHPS